MIKIENKTGHEKGQGVFPQYTTYEGKYFSLISYTPKSTKAVSICSYLLHFYAIPKQFYLAFVFEYLNRPPHMRLNFKIKNLLILWKNKPTREVCDMWRL